MARSLPVPANGEVEGPHRRVQLEPRAHNVFQRPRRDYGVSRTPPTIVRGHRYCSLVPATKVRTSVSPSAQCSVKTPDRVPVETVTPNVCGSTHLRVGEGGRIRSLSKGRSRMTPPGVTMVTE
jgi:hypothetical protein